MAGSYAFLLNQLFGSVLIINIVLLGGCANKHSYKTKKILFNDHSGDCTKQSGYQEQGNGFWIERECIDSGESICAQEAQLVDIPIPLQAIALVYQGNKPRSSEHTTLLAYKVPSSYEELCSFFSLEMERLGWNMVSSLESAESLLVFIKPTKICTISLRASHNARDEYMIVISYGIYDEGASQQE